MGGHGKVRFGRKVLDMSIIGVTADVLETLIADATDTTGRLAGRKTFIT